MQQYKKLLILTLSSIRPFVISHSKTMRTASLRVIRYYLPKGPNAVLYFKELLSLRIQFFIARYYIPQSTILITRTFRSLERDKHSEAERLQALKLVRVMIEVDSSLMPASIVQALIACAENQEDSFCRVCLETICEIG